MIGAINAFSGLEDITIVVQAIEGRPGRPAQYTARAKGEIVASKVLIDRHRSSLIDQFSMAMAERGMNMTYL